MPPRRVIGIDAGGTKLLGGVVDETLAVHHRVHRRILGLDQGELLDALLDAVEEARAVAPDAAVVGFGIPALVRPGTGSVMVSNHLPLDGLPFRDLMSERLGLPGAGGQRLERGRCSPSTVPVPLAGSTTPCSYARHRHRRRAADERRGVLRLRGRRGRARPHRGGPGRTEVPRRLPGPRLPRGVRLRHRDRPEGRPRRPRANPGSALGRRWRAGARSPARSSRSWPTTATRSRARCSPRRAAGWASAWSRW